MEASSRAALKEWAALEQVLAAGRSCLLLRKGGLRERRGGFEVEHREFWIFPTHFHQSPSELRPEHAWALEAARAVATGPDEVRLQHYAVVTDAFRVERLEVLERLHALHALTADTVAARFRYRGRPYLHALVVRLHRLPEPRMLPGTLGYEGCVSWVELDEAVPTAAALPVLDAGAFEAARGALLEALAGAEGVARV